MVYSFAGSNHTMKPFLLVLLLAASLLLPCYAETPADRVYRNGKVFTADVHGTVAQAIAIRDGRIVYVGTNDGVAPFIAASTKVSDLHGRFLMPGLIDGHMHPLEAGLKLRKCSLNYEPLTLQEMQSRIQACLDKTKNQEPDGWLEVVSWFQESMRPPGVKTSRATLDVLKTSRPIIVHSSFGHTVLANSRALELAKITRNTPDPLGGKIWRDANGNPTGLFEDAAFDVFYDLIPKPTPEENIAGAKEAQNAMLAQGVTSFLDAAAPPITKQENLLSRCRDVLLSRCAARIVPEKIEWIWYGRLARGKHACAAGEPGGGKSTLAVDICARLTTGGEWPRQLTAQP